MDDLLAVRVETPYFLQNGYGGWENVQLVGGARVVDPCHV